MIELLKEARALLGAAPRDWATCKAIAERLGGAYLMQAQTAARPWEAMQQYCVAKIEALLVSAGELPARSGARAAPESAKPWEHRYQGD